MSGSDSEAALAELIKDYKAAARANVPGYTGGISRKIAVELIRMGWRKPTQSGAAAK